MVDALLSQFATGAGLMAAGIAVGGFVFHAGPALTGAGETDLRRATVGGGLIAMGIAMGLIVLSVILGLR